MTDKQRHRLISTALETRQRAYAAYSHFQVGASLMTPDGTLISGCNVENASYGLTLCAERVAVGTAVAAGYRQFVALAVAAPGGPPPCGACRQMLAEFAPHLPILLVDADSPQRVLETSLEILLPAAFTRESLP